MANVDKPKTTTFQLGEILTGMSEEYSSWSIKGEGPLTGSIYDDTPNYQTVGCI